MGGNPPQSQNMVAPGASLLGAWEISTVDCPIHAVPVPHGLEPPQSRNMVAPGALLLGAWEISQAN